LSLKDRLAAKTPLFLKEKAELIQKKEPAIPQMDTVVAFGAIDTLLIDEDLNSIYVNGAKNIYVERKGKVNKSTKVYRDNVQLENIARKIINDYQLSYKNSEELSFKFNYREGINFFMTIPPLTNNVTISVKCYNDKFASLQTLEEEKTVSKELSLALQAITNLKNNIIITGERNSLKTTLLSALAKKAPANFRNVLIDFACELKNKSLNFSSFNFAKVSEIKQQIEILDNIFNSNPDKIFVNDCPEELIGYFVQKIDEGFKGLLLTIKAKDEISSINKIIKATLRYNSGLDKDEIKDIIYDNFDLILTTKLSEVTSKRYVASLCQIRNKSIENIIALNDIQEHVSFNLVPEFYEDAKVSSLPLNANIFSSEYKHTYFQTQIVVTPHKTTTIEILKKFRADLATEAQKAKENNIEENITEEKTLEEKIEKTIPEIEEIKAASMEEKTENKIIPDEKSFSNSLIEEHVEELEVEEKKEFASIEMGALIEKEMSKEKEEPKVEEKFDKDLEESYLSMISETLSSEDKMIKHAQEKFEALKKNAHSENN